MRAAATMTRQAASEPRVTGLKAAPRVLLVGYNGTCNTGAEALLLSDIADLRSLLGPEARLTVPTLNQANLRRYLAESPTLRIAPIPTLYFAAVDRLVREHDLVLLVEGSTYMDSWGSALLWAFLWATQRAAARGIPVLAYAVDAGSLSPFNRRLVRRAASRTDLIITRSAPAAERLRACGVTAPIQVTADNAFNFQPSPADEGWVEREWPQAAEGLVGLSVVDFHLWPAVMRLWGRKDECYKWPYYFSRSAERRRSSEELAGGYARLADWVAGELGRPVALICMEPVDEPLARRIQALMAESGRARLFCSRRYNASQMTVLLRSLDLLVTSRFHAGVLSLAARMPQVAVGHDFRLDSLYRDLGLRERFFVESHSPWMFEEIRERLELLAADPYRQRDALAQGHKELLARALNNRRLLAGFLRDHGWGR